MSEPILSFTADEVWSYLPKGSVDQESVHLSAFPEKASVIFDKELSVKWIGREAVINWLVSNQILFEVISQGLLPEEREALGEAFEETKSDFKPNLLN